MAEHIHFSNKVTTAKLLTKNIVIKQSIFSKQLPQNTDE